MAIGGMMNLPPMGGGPGAGVPGPEPMGPGVGLPPPGGGGGMEGLGSLLEQLMGGGGELKKFVEPLNQAATILGAVIAHVGLRHPGVAKKLADAQRQVLDARLLIEKATPGGPAGGGPARPPNLGPVPGMGMGGGPPLTPTPGAPMY